jgi:hypothetical protein
MQLITEYEGVHIYKEKDMFHFYLNAKRHGDWRSLAEAKGGVEVELRRTPFKRQPVVL